MRHYYFTPLVTRGWRSRCVVSFGSFGGRRRGGVHLQALADKTSKPQALVLKDAPTQAKRLGASQAEGAQSQTEGSMQRRSRSSDSDCSRHKTNGKYWHFSIRQKLRKSPACWHNMKATYWRTLPKWWTIPLKAWQCAKINVLLLSGGEVLQEIHPGQIP